MLTNVSVAGAVWWAVRVLAAVMVGVPGSDSGPVYDRYVKQEIHPNGEIYTSILVSDDRYMYRKKL